MNEQSAVSDDVTGEFDGVVPFTFFINPSSHKVSWRRCASDADAAAYAEQHGLVLCDEPREFEIASY